MNTVTHVAGPSVCFESGRFIQRCIVCGEILSNGNTNNMGNQVINFWAVGALVQCDGGNDDPVRHMKLIGMLAENFKDDDLPVDFCIALVEK